MLYDNQIASDNVELFLNHLHQETGEDNFPVESETKNYCLARLSQERMANELSEPAKYKSVLPALHGRDADSSFVEIKSEEAIRSSQEELRQLSTQLLTIQEQERQRIAADLHDGIGQSLSLIKLSLESVMQQINAGERQEALESLQQLNQTVKETMAELHRTTMDMRPSMLDDLGIIPTLSWFFREFEAAWQGRQIEKDVSIAESDVPVPLKATIFRILQEAMNNILKHACADLIRVSLKKSGGSLQLSIEDNGRGFDLDRVSQRCASGSCGFACGFGLLTMKERARSTKGVFEMKSTLEQGTRIFISWQFVDSTAN
jgi:signal transduction histidine kinase